MIARQSTVHRFPILLLQFPILISSGQLSSRWGVCAGSKVDTGRSGIGGGLGSLEAIKTFESLSKDLIFAGTLPTFGRSQNMVRIF